MSDHPIPVHSYVSQACGVMPSWPWPASYVEEFLNGTGNLSLDVSDTFKPVWHITATTNTANTVAYNAYKAYASTSSTTNRMWSGDFNWGGSVA